MATKYDRIAADLRRKIRSGELKPGQQMPVETALKDDYRVSLLTLRRALEQLTAEGLIERRHGIGTFVRLPRQPVRRVNTQRYQWEKDRVFASKEERSSTGGTEFDTGLKVTDLKFQARYRVIEADSWLANQFGIKEGSRLLERNYRTGAQTEDSPLSMSRSYLVYDMISANPELLDEKNEPWPGGTPHQLWTVGIELDRITDEVRARPPSLDEVEVLGIEPSGVAVIALRKTCYDTLGRVVEIAEAVYDGDRTEMVYEISLARWPSE